MITIEQTPTPNSIIPDGNVNVIAVKSVFLTVPAPLTYLQADIYVDDELFVSQLWSKNSEGRAEFDTKGMYRNYFPDDFHISGANGITVIEELIKKIKIIIYERKIADDSLIDTKELPVFYLLKSTYPQIIPADPVSWLDYPTEVIHTTSKSIVRLGVLLRPGQALNISLLSLTGTPIPNTTYTLESNERPRVVQIIYNLSLFPSFGALSTTNIYINCSTGAFFTRKTIVFKHLTIFKRKTLYFQNSFGVYCSLDMFGVKEEQQKLKQHSYQTALDNTQVFFVEAESEIKIRSGYVRESMLELFVTLSRSINIYLIHPMGVPILYNSSVRSVRTKLENVHVHDYQLVLTRRLEPISSNPMVIVKMDPVEFEGFGNADNLVESADLLEPYTDTEPPTYIYFPTPTVNGSLFYRNSSDEIIELFNDNIPAPASGNLIPIANFVELIFRPNFNAYGLPLEIIDYRLKNSNFDYPGTVNINIDPFSPDPEPPKIIIKELHYVPINDVGDGYLAISTEITDPSGGNVSILWESTDLKVSFNDNTLAEPVISLTGVSDLDEFSVTVSAESDLTSLSTSAEISLMAIFHVLTQSSEFESYMPHSYYYDFLISGATPNAEVELYVEFSKMGSMMQSAFIDEYLLLIGDNLTKTIVFDSNGEANFDIVINDPEESEKGRLLLQMKNPSAGNYIIDDTIEIDISLININDSSSE
jgi:hypothetical protein